MEKVCPWLCTVKAPLCGEITINGLKHGELHGSVNAIFCNVIAKNPRCLLNDALIWRVAVMRVLCIDFMTRLSVSLAKVHSGPKWRKLCLPENNLAMEALLY